MKKETEQNVVVEEKENTRLHYRGYKQVVVKAILVRDLLGTDPADEATCLKHNAKQINLLPRDDKGNIRFKSTWIRAMLRDTSHAVQVSKNIPLKYIFNYSVELLKMGGKPYIKSMAIMPEDKGIKSGKILVAEYLPKGTEFQISCLIPTDGVGGVKPELFQKWLSIGLQEGIGAFRKGEFGVATITDFKVKSMP